MNASKLDLTAFLSEAKPSSGPWVAEEKFDGNRIQIYFDNERVLVLTRGGKDVSASIDGLATFPRWGQAVLDGELLPPQCHEHTVYDVRSAIGGLAETGLQWQQEHGRLRFVIFDVLCNEAGQLLVQQPLRTRRQYLEQLFRTNSSALLSLVPLLGKQFVQEYEAVIARGGEGLMLKRLDRPYSPGKRNQAWLKVKSQQTWDWIVTGFTQANEVNEQGTRTKFAGLVGAVQYGGYDPVTRITHTIGQCSGMTDAIRALMTTAPELFLGKVIEIKGQSADAVTGVIRHPSFLGLRDDKEPTECCFTP